ncbi:MAG: RDD family protein [Opitutaceae bacterium]|nr:RDD family protein [Opitutaceae bacterium]
MFTIIGGDGREYGPVTTEQVRAWIKAGRANLETKARAAGTEDWLTLGDFAEFNPQALPPVIAASPEFEAAPTPDPLEPGGRGARIGAAMINAFLYFLCTIPGSLKISRKLVEQYPEIARGTMPPLGELDLTVVMDGVLWVWAGLGAGIVLQAVILTLRGQNFGKLIFGLRVVRAEDGQPAGFVRGALLRFLIPVLIVVVLNMFTAVVGFLFLLVDLSFMAREDGRCLHDLMAGTRVVKA